MAKVSVIVPNYNHAKYLPQRLDSIFNQTFQDFEVILLDDCSADNSVEVLKKYAKHPKVSHFIVNEQNSGSTFKQWKKGVELAKGKYIWVAESDDWADESFLEELVALLENNKRLGFAYSQSYIVDSRGFIEYVNTVYTDYLDTEKWKNNYICKGIEEINNYLVYRNIIPNVSAVLFNKSELIVNKAVMSFSYIGDWFLYISILIHGKDIAYIAQPLNYYRQHYKTVRSKALSDGRREKEYFILLRFLLKNKSVKREIVGKQIVENFKTWKKKYSSLSWHVNQKIRLQYLKTKIAYLL